MFLYKIIGACQLPTITSIKPSLLKSPEDKPLHGRVSPTPHDEDDSLKTVPEVFTQSLFGVLLFTRKISSQPSLLTSTKITPCAAPWSSTPIKAATSVKVTCEKLLLT